MRRLTGYLFPFFLFVLPSSAANLTGNWVVESPRPDGTVAKSYFHLQQDGSQISGTIRVTQFYYTITNSTGNSDAFTITGKVKDGDMERQVLYEGKLEGDELHLATRRRQDNALVESVAHRAAEGEGAWPARIPPPALHKVPDNGLAKTPPLGWNSWNKFRGEVQDSVVRQIADAMVASGMKVAGYQYVNIDDTWESNRDANGNIVPNKKFPDMKALADYVHSKGLKLGIYSSPGPNTCAGYEGSYGHEEQDARTYAAWGIDYLKYDWCGARNVYTDQEMQPIYQKMGDALQASGRPIVYSLCQYGRAEVWKWGPDVGGNLWRTTGDIRDSWDSMSRIGFAQNDLAEWARPGHWNDPDMLEVGNGGMKHDEYITHMSLWVLLAAPLLAGNDLSKMTSETLNILTNREVVAVDQDAKGMQGRRIAQEGPLEVWAKPLADGSSAVGLFNRSESTSPITVNFKDLGLHAAATVRDLWQQKDLGSFANSYTQDVPRHGAALIRIH